MRNLILITATLSMLLFGCGCDEKKKTEADVEAVTDAGTSSDAETSQDAGSPADAVVIPGDVTPQG